jgi:glycosyltransferase involved in cell wall biosynthesis
MAAKIGYLEISALLEEHWTGIPAVTAAIAQYAMNDQTMEWRFFYGSMTVPRSFIGQLLARRTGKQAGDFLLAHVWGKHEISYADAGNGKAIFTTLKTVRNLFAEEAVVLYDFSPILTPQFHTGETVNHFSNRFRGDIETSDHFFCISEATKNDLLSYFEIEATKTSVVPMGIDISLLDVSLGQQVGREYNIEPYVLVLGTLEPRKNGRLVLQYLARDPGFSSRFRLVFVGREGWMAERQQLMADIEAAGVHSDRVVFSGYVSEAEKVALLLNCKFCIYASHFEGYGLPILEAAKLGKLIVCSSSSSMPEVAPDKCFFFDPRDLIQFGRAISLAEKRVPQLRSPSMLPDIAGLLKEATWEECYRIISEWVKA